ncbi:syncytin-1-like [Rhinolophus ferrumequinum]|uniref:syncytin-1-like n=1 Tax=Rhinolophus ferrumequinum TaxID=59479 RepID=UPI00140F51BA|nr:syncytin-1-like [Rhinolophus ferrumequinum]
MPRECYQGATPSTCEESGRTYWTATLTQTFQSPCNSFPRGPVCWSYLAQAGSSDGRDAQDTTLHKVAATRISAIARAALPRPRYRRLNLTSLRRPPLLGSPDFTSHLLNTSYQFWLNSTSLPIGSPCWICLPLIRSAFFGIPVPPNWPFHNSTNTSASIVTEPIGDPVPLAPLAPATNLTCYLPPGLTQAPDPRCQSFSAPLPFCTPPGIFLFCDGGHPYRCRDAHHNGSGCILTFISPSAAVFTDAEFQSQVFPSLRTHRAAFIPFLIGAGIFTGVAAGASGLGTSIDFYYKLSQELNDDMERVADSLVSLQTQLSSLAAVALQNRWALDLLMAEKGGTCLFLQEECCYYINQSGILATKVRELRDRIQHRREELASWGFGSQSWTSWLLPLAGPLLSIFLLATIGLCILNALVRFIENTVSRLTTARILALRGYRPLSLNDDLQGSPSDHQQGGHVGTVFSPANPH